jgi:hypothetical protein
MSDTDTRYTGGCLCDAVRYEAVGEPQSTGHCYCADCRKASGSGFISFVGSPPTRCVSAANPAVQVEGVPGRRRRAQFLPDLRQPRVRRRAQEGHVAYDLFGSLDDPSLFRPQLAIFIRDRPVWVGLPLDLTTFETMPD